MWAPVWQTRPRLLSCARRDPCTRQRFADLNPASRSRLFTVGIGSAPNSFKLTSSRVSPNGLIIGHYERGGEIKIGDTGLDSPSDREVARRARMKRET